MKHLYNTLILIAIFVLPVTQAGAIDKTTRWADPSSVVLDVEFPGDGYHANWQLFRCDCGDLLVHSELNIPGEVEVGETLLVGGRAMLSRGFGELQAELGASLDAPALMMQLALRLLERSAPAGPGSISERVEVDLLDEINHINLDTATAVGGFQAPWSIEGHIEPAGETHRRFDLHFFFTVPTADGIQKASMRLKGEAEFAKTPFPVAGDEPLAGWEMVWRDPEDPAMASASGVTTLGELRTVIEEN
jgi:hypothetical protein